MDRDAAFTQSGHDIRFDWGADGIARVGPCAEAIVVVDVLSFSTAVDVAVSRGATVFPYRWRDASASTFAVEHDAILAGNRDEGGLSLAPSSLGGLQSGDRIVLSRPTAPRAA